MLSRLNLMFLFYQIGTEQTQFQKYCSRSELTQPTPRQQQFVVSIWLFAFFTNAVSISPFFSPQNSGWAGSTWTKIVKSYLSYFAHKQSHSYDSYFSYNSGSIILKKIRCLISTFVFFTKAFSIWPFIFIFHTILVEPAQPDVSLVKFMLSWCNSKYCSRSVWAGSICFFFEKFGVGRLNQKKIVRLRRRNLTKHWTRL